MTDISLVVQDDEGVSLVSAIIAKEDVSRLENFFTSQHSSLDFHSSISVWFKDQIQALMRHIEDSEKQEIQAKALLEANKIESLSVSFD